MKTGSLLAHSALQKEKQMRRMSNRIRKFNFHFIVFVLFIPMYAFADGICSENNWCWQNPVPQGNDINDMHVVDSETTWLVGDAGIVLKTEDGGSTWNAKDVGTSENLYGIHFVSNEEIWISGGNGVLLHSTNGGEDWVSQVFTNYSHLRDIQFLDSQNGWVVGYGSANWFPCSSGLCYSQGEDIYKTIDGGVTWTDMYNGTFSDDDPRKVFFVDLNRGWVLAAGEIYRTIDGGENWTPLTPEISLGSSDITFDGLFFLNANQGWAVGDGHIIVTDDGGDTWSFQPEDVWQDLNDIHFVDANHGWAVGGGVLLYTNDGGASWQSHTETSSTEHEIFNVVKSSSSSHVVVGGNTGAVVQSLDGGQHVSPLVTDITDGYTNASFQQVSFSDAQYGWIVDDFQNDTFYQTHNGGESWQLRHTGLDVRFESITFLNRTLGWAVGQGGTIVHTQDGGQNWESQISGTSQGLLSVYFQSATRGWVTSREGILATADGGETWELQYLSSQYIYDISFLNDQVGWACGSSGLILYTEDGGTTWTPKSPVAGNSFFSIAVVDASTVVAVNFDGKIYRTTDTGTTWESSDSGVDGYLKDVQFASTSQGWIVGAYGAILSTDDGGTTWVKEQSGTDKSLYSIHVLDSAHRWVVGEAGVVLNTAPVSDTISGTVRRSIDNTPITGDEDIEIVVYGHDEGILFGSPITSVSINSADGTYAISGLPEGQYHIRAEARNYIDEFYAGSASVYYSHLSELITIGGSYPLIDKDFQLEAGETIAGTLYAADGITTLGGFGVSVVVDLAGSGEACGTEWTFGTTSGTSGVFSVHVPEGTFFISAGGQVDGDIRIDEWWASSQSVRDCVDAEPIQITIGSSAEGNDFYLDQGVLISGKIYRSSDNSVIENDPTIAIGVVRDGPCISQGADYSNLINPDDGTYHLIVEPGSYYINVTANHFINEFWTTGSDEYFCQNAEQFSVSLGDTPTFDFYLEVGTIVSGTIFNYDGSTPLIGQDHLGVAFWSDPPCDVAYPQAALFTTFVDPTDGSYQCHVPPGSYHLRANTGNYFTSEWWAGTTSDFNCNNAQIVSVLTGVDVESKDFQISIDTDDDNLADDWELANYENLEAVDAETDSDDDGLNALDEFVNKTNPHDNDTDSDGITDEYEVNVAETDPNNPLDTPPLPFTPNVQNRHDNTGYHTQIELDINMSGFAGRVPEDIDSIDISGPGGFTLTEADLINDGGSYYYAILSDSPQLGVYDYTVTSGVLNGTGSDTQSVNHNIPLPDLATAYPTTAETIYTLNPVFHWSLVDYSATPLYYHCRLYNQSGTRVFRSNAAQDATSCAVPEGTLQPGENYTFQIRVYDDMDWSSVQNQAQAETTITIASDAAVRGDVSGDGQIDLTDAILSLQVAGGNSTDGVHLGGDVNGDRLVGIAEAIFVLETIKTDQQLFPMIYASDEGASQIRRFSVASSSADHLNLSVFSTPYGVGIDQTNRKVYWTDYNNDTLYRADFDGANLEEVVNTGLDFPSGVAIDEVNEKVYWGDFGNNTIKSSNLDGSNVETLLSGPDISGPVGIVLDAAGGFFYFADENTKKIQRANLDGSNLTDIVTDLPHPHGLVFSSEQQRLFWTNWLENSGSLQSSNIDGSNVTTLVSGLDWGLGITIDTKNNRLFYSHEHGIRSCNFDGSDDRGEVSVEHASFIQYVD